MYLFSRTRVAHPAHLGAAVACAIDLGKRSSEVTGMTVDTWISMMSTDANTIGWTVWVEHLVDLETGFDKLIADTDYNDMVTRADAVFTGPLVDRLVDVLTPLPADASPAAYVAVVNGAAANGHLAEAVQHGLAIAAAATATSGTPTLFGVSATGTYGGLSFFTGAPDIGALETTQRAINDDPAFVQLVDSGGRFFQPGAEQLIFRRLG